MFNIDLQHLMVIRTILKEGSMTRAAEKMHLTQSALSHHLSVLEKNIGARIFDADRRSGSFFRCFQDTALRAHRRGHIKPAIM